MWIAEYRVLVGELEEKRPFEDLVLESRKIKK